MNGRHVAAPSGAAAIQNPAYRPAGACLPADRPCGRPVQPETRPDLQRPAADANQCAKSASRENDIVIHGRRDMSARSASSRTEIRRKTFIERIFLALLAALLCALPGAA